jgi:TonB family protein
MTWMTFLTENAWKATVLLSAACAAGVLLRGRPASLRHFVWTAVFAALVGLPAAMLVMPKWAAPVGRVSVHTVSVAPVAKGVQVAYPARTGRRLASGQTVPTDPPRTPAILLLVWLAGCLAAASRFLVGSVRTSWMVRRAAPAAYAQGMLEDLRKSLELGRPVRALESSAAPMPLTWGILRPVVILPDDAPRWPEARLRTVLLHELVHVRRLDLLAQVVAQAGCCLYWFHPLALVGHLLDLVRSLAAKRSPWADAPAMAESSDLESRVRALLDRNRSRRPLSRRAAIAIAALAVAVLLPLAAIHAQGATGILAGTVSDPSDARVPHCRVTAQNLDGSNQETAITNEAGEYRFASIPAGRYALEFGAPGFGRAKAQAVLVAGASARVDAHLEIGGVSENLVVRGQKPSAVAAPRSSETAQRIRVGGMVSQVRLVRQPRPVYPPELQQLGVEGTVIISAIVSKDGSVLNPTVRNTVDPRLAAAAIEAVKQWVYQPALLNGEPVEILTTITLEFQLGQ